jgi:isopenicillin N synthase-like dioxygenase
LCSSLVDLDNKLRFFWTIGKVPSHTDFPQLYPDPVIPDGFPEWQTVMDSWGALLAATVTTVAEMCAQGLGLSVDTFTSLMGYSLNLLGPTGIDLARFGKLGTVLASYHSDMGFLTIHGRARFPGLFVWTREGKRVAVEVPYGCLLLQAGTEFEWLTGGQVLAGFHEVVVSEQTVKTIDEAARAGRSLWRVSSTMFTGIATDQVLQPLEPFATPETLKMYPPTTAGAHLLAELAAINLAKTLN